MKKCLIASTVSRQFTLFERGNIEVLKKLGYEVHCVANYLDATEEIDALGIIKHNIDIQRSPFSIKNLRAYKQLKKIINSDDYELIHCHSPMGGVLTRLAARKKRKKGLLKVIYTAHGFHFFKGATIINWLLYYTIEKWLSKYTDCIITINKEDYEIANKKFQCPSIKFINGIGVDKNRFDFEMPEKEKNEFRNSIGIKGDDFVIIYVAELSKRKNQGMIIDTFKELIKENKKIKLLLVGKDSLSGKYQKIARKYGLEEYVKFLGFRNDIPKLMKISDLCVSTSRQEGLPVNIMEAMMCNLPVIATNCRGNRDLINNGKNGFIIPIDDNESLKDKILFFINNNFVVENNVEKYFLENIKYEMEKIYESIFNKRVIHLLSTNSFSGAENVACQIINLFRFDDFEMFYCSLDGSIRDVLLQEKINFIPIKKLNYIYFKRIIKKYNPDIIHAHDIRASVISSLFNNKKRVIISHIHGNHDNMKKLSIKSFLFLLCSKKFKKIFWVSVSSLRDYVFTKKVKKNSQVLINVIDIKQINKKVLEDPNNYCYDIIYLGRLSHEKNPLRVYNIMKNCCIKDNRIKCVFVGDGYLRKEIEEKIINDNMIKNIELKGNVSNPMKILKSSKVMLMASKYEGTPMSALEAMALGIPIVSTPTDGLIDLITNNKNGFLSNNDNELEYELEKIIKDDNYRKELSNNTMKIFDKLNSIKDYKKILEKEYNYNKK